MNHGSLFSGIGGFDLAAEWMGWNNVFHCEWNPFGQRVLKHYWPNAKSYNDINKSDFSIHRGQIDILTGGFPCQPYSSAGKRLGKEDDRHLWPEMLRAIREIQPRWVVGENVRGLTNWNGGLVFDEVQADLENEGYEVTPFLLPACAVDAPHRRDRIWFIAYASGKRYRGRQYKHGEFEERQVCPDEQKRNGVRREDSTRSEVITDSASDRRFRERPSPSYEDRESKPEQRGIMARRFEGLRAHGLVAYPQGKRFREARPDFSRSEKWSAGTSDERILANSAYLGHEWARKAWIGRDGFANSSSRVFAYPDSQQRREGRLHQTEREAAERHISAFDSRNGRGAWKDFPTQPPVRSGNDGFPTGLDGITVSKWRTESIKGGGNAIVPQVALQIFKAIDQYEQLQKQLNLFAA